MRLNILNRQGVQHRQLHFPRSLLQHLICYHSIPASSHRIFSFSFALFSGRVGYWNFGVILFEKLEYYIHTSNKAPLFAYSDPDIKKEPAADKESGHTVFAVLYPDDNIDYTEYQSRVNELLTLPQLDSLILTSSTVEAPYGLFDTFKKQTDGITVTLANIPEVEKNEDGKVLELRVAEGDMGKVIGRQGRIAKEIRTIIKTVAQRTGEKVTVEIVD